MLNSSSRKGPKRSLLITDISWGRMLVERVGDGKDFKLWPGGGRAWDWGETDTHHVPGIQPAIQRIHAFDFKSGSSLALGRRCINLRHTGSHPAPLLV